MSTTDICVCGRQPEPRKDNRGTWNIWCDCGRRSGCWDRRYGAVNDWNALPKHIAALTPASASIPADVERLWEYFEATEALIVLDGMSNDPAGFIVDWSNDDLDDDDQAKWDRFCDARDALAAAPTPTDSGAKGAEVRAKISAASDALLSKPYLSDNDRERVRTITAAALKGASS